MKRHRLIGTLLLLAAASAGGAAIMQSAAFRQALTWLGGGGGTATSASFVNTVSIGQPVAGAVIGGGSFQLRGGFIQPSAAAITPLAGGSCTVIANPSADATCSVSGANGTVTVLIPAGSFSQAVTLNLTLPGSFPSGTSSVGGLAGLPLGVDMSVSPSLAPQKPFTVTFAYQEADVPSGREDRLRPSFFDVSRGRWIPLSGSLDATGNTVAMSFSSFGLFQLMQLAPAADLERGLAFPNPMRPGMGHTQMTFGNLPEGVEVRLFTLTGELVRALLTDGAGQASWDGVNGDGEKVRSGVYLAVFQRGSDNRVIKIAVER